MKTLWTMLLVFLIADSLAYSKRKLKLRSKHRLFKQREHVNKVEARKGFPNADDRNMSKVYDTVHKYSDKTRQSANLKRHYLGHISGLEQAHYDSNHQNGLNGIATADVGVHPSAPNVGYLDAAHGIATTLNSQKLQVGTQAAPAHHPSDDGLNPLSMYHSKDALSHQDTVTDHHLDPHIVNGRVTDGLAQNHFIGATANIADETVVESPHFATSHASQELSAEQEGASFLQHQQGAINLVHGNPSRFVHHVHDDANVQQVDLNQQNFHQAVEMPAVINHHMGNYYHGGVELEHHLAHQQPVVISHPPIHLTKAHHHTTYHDVEDQGSVEYHPCINGGVFVPTGPHTYDCICPEQYIGKNCQEVDHCHPCPCKNKGRCHNIVELPKYKCTCPAGFYGDHCENKDPCHPNPCQNNGKCSHDGKGKVECVCPVKFKGEKCEVLHSCKPNPCLNAGACMEIDGKGKFECQCTEQFRGAICNKPRFCYKNPCQNGGVCQEDHENFNCICVHGWRGRICEERACKPNPCRNGATCTETADGKDFKCICLPWHSGKLCEENRPCLTRPCMNGGKCIDSFSGFHWSYGPLQFYCICNPPYTGEKCEVHGCRNCHKNAHCEGNKCICDDGYKGNGKICIKKADPCHPNPCENGGFCVQKGDTDEFECRCVKPYKPPYCKERDPCDPNPCKNEAQCTPNGDGSYNCVCPPGYRGPDCGQQDACSPNPCQHGGTCSDNNGTALCECKGKWSGPLCKECSCPKKSLPGVPDITCDINGKCICPTGYTVDLIRGMCLKDKKGGGDACISRPCVNNGVCQSSSDGQYTCKCPPGYLGKNCPIKDPCIPNPCNNNGICHSDKKTGKFIKCDCPPKFPLPPFCYGKDKPGAGPCDDKPCKNGGTCVVNGKSYDCICVIRYTGPTCAIDNCANCDDHAACINGRCKCKAGYIGNGYECVRDVPTCAQKCPQYSTCVIPTGNCQCQQGYTFVDRICMPLTDGDEEATGESAAENTEAAVPTEKPEITVPVTPTDGGGATPTGPTSVPVTTVPQPIPPTTSPRTTAVPKTTAGATKIPQPPPPAPPPAPPPSTSPGSLTTPGPPGPPSPPPPPGASPTSSTGGNNKPPGAPPTSGGSKSPASPPGASGGSSGSAGPPGTPESSKKPSGGSSGSSGPPGSSDGSKVPPNPPIAPGGSSGSAGPPGAPGGSKGSAGPPGAPGGSKGSAGPPGAPGGSKGSAGPPGAPGGSVRSFKRNRTHRPTSDKISGQEDDDELDFSVR